MAGNTVKKPTRLIAIDVGLVRIGLALSDPLKMIATPLENFLAEKNLARTIEKLLAYFAKLQQEKDCVLEAIIVGMPFKLQGTDSASTTHVRNFVAALEQATTIPVKIFDERLTTVQADRALQEGGFSRKKRSKLVDRISAVILLQSYLQLHGGTL